MKSIISLLILLQTLNTFAQTEKLNQFDDKGKKHGKWVIYWDNNWKQVDSVNAIYARYTFYDHGDNLNAMGPCGAKGWELVTNEYTSNKFGKALLLDGEFNWMDPKKVMRFSFVIKNGEFVSYKEYNKAGVMTAFFDYTKEYNGQKHSYKVNQYDKDGKLKSEMYMVKDMNNNRYSSRPK